MKNLSVKADRPFRTIINEDLAKVGVGSYLDSALSFFSDKNQEFTDFNEGLSLCLRQAFWRFFRSFDQLAGLTGGGNLYSTDKPASPFLPGRAFESALSPRRRISFFDNLRSDHVGYLGW